MVLVDMSHPRGKKIIKINKKKKEKTKRMKGFDLASRSLLMQFWIHPTFNEMLRKNVAFPLSSGEEFSANFKSSSSNSGSIVF